MDCVFGSESSARQFRAEVLPDDPAVELQSNDSNVSATESSQSNSTVMCVLHRDRYLRKNQRID